MDVKYTRVVAKNKVEDHKIDRLIAFYHRYGRWPKRSEADKETGLAVGQLLDYIKQGKFKLVEHQRIPLLAVDPHALDVEHISHANKTMINDQKINRLIAFHKYYGMWPKPLF